MPLSCGARALKFSLFIFNLVFLLCGLVCVGMGTWLLVDQSALDSIALATSKVQGYDQDPGLRDLATKPIAVRQIGKVLLFGGVLVIIIAFLGCCGAAKEWRPLLCCYATCLMVILATEIAAAIYAALHSHMFDKDFREILRASLKMYNGTDAPRRYKDDHDAGSKSDAFLVKAAWDKYMIDKKCCGVDSVKGEFNHTGWYTLMRGKYEFPPACCRPDKAGRLQPQCFEIMRYKDGCMKELQYWNRTHFSAIFGILTLLGIIEIVCFVVGVWLFQQIDIERLYFY
ncbi:unnamed protein product, partial [Mesorhabditis belari]|uniref:Tetraspanin n=1 Tax=Mesorhabditis belari TaxID=2138241 RepID=A0AAF3FPY3_9BILA